MKWIPLFFIILLCAVSACKSPLNINTPRDRNTDGSGDSLAVDSTRISVALVLDASGSMSGYGNTLAKNGALAFVDSLDGKIDEAAIIWFTDAVTIRQAITHDRDSLRSAISVLPATGGTALWDGTYQGLLMMKGGATNRTKAVIVLTDGVDNCSTRQAEELIAFATKAGISIFYLGLGTTVSATELESVAQATGGTYTDVFAGTEVAAYRRLLVTLRKHR
jgi:Mg-chelatase subunit ChlD